MVAPEIDELSLSPRVVPSLLPEVLGSEVPVVKSVEELLLPVDVEAPVVGSASVAADELVSDADDVVEPPPSSPHPVNATVVTAKSFGMVSLRMEQVKAAG